MIKTIIFLFTFFWIACNDGINKPAIAGSDTVRSDTTPFKKTPMHTFKDIKEMDAYFKPQYDSIINKRKEFISKNTNGQYVSEINTLDSSLLEVQLQQTEARLNYLKDNHASEQDMMQLIALVKAQEINIEQLFKLFELFGPAQKESGAGKLFRQFLFERVKKESKQSIDVSLMHHPFTSATGQVFTLSQTTAPYTLLELWASWCMPCRVQNRKLLNELSKKGNPETIQIIAISLDVSREKWLHAVTEDKMDPVINISDLKGWESDFLQKTEINSIPCNLLIDKKGKIIARNIPPEQLKQMDDSLSVTAKQH